MQKYRITHITRYYYNRVVPISHHAAKLLPREAVGQTCLLSELSTTPAPEVVHEGGDYFGNRCHHFTISEPHQQLDVIARSEVEVDPDPVPVPEKTVPWEKAIELLKSPEMEELFDAYPYIFPSVFVPDMEEVRAYAKESFQEDEPLMLVALGLMDRIHHDFIFDPAATQVSTPLSEVLQNKRGVCQDFAHFQIACFRSMGLPARYVSGYLRTIPPAGCERLRGADASHAWVQVFCPGAGWVDFDPTNNVIPADSHIKVAWGRDYDDVSPLRGITYGGGSQLLEVSVDVEAVG